MKSMSIRVRSFLFFLYIAGGFALFATYTLFPFPTYTAPIVELPIYIVLAAAAGHKKVNLLGFRRSDLKDTSGTMSLGFAMIFATLLRFGPQGAIIAGLASTISSCIRPRMPWYQFLFNVSVNLIETSIAGIVFLALNRYSLELSGFQIILPVTIACLTFFFLNTGLVATIIALNANRRPLDIWLESFLWTAPSYIIGAGVSTLASVAMSNRLLATILCAVPVALLTHASFRAFLDRNEALLASKEELATLYLATIRSLALAIDAKDQFTHQHILRVQRYAVATAQQMGIAGDELKAIETGALLHDIGKLGVPEYVLLKPGHLSPDEFNKIKEHPRIGADILDPVKFPWPVLPVVKYHHERWDGTGYPEGLKGEDIPRTARILAVADVYDALTSSRSYRAAWNHERAIVEIRNKAGSHFDPSVVRAFVQVVDEVRDQIKRTMDDPDTLISRNSQDELPITTPRSAAAVRTIQRSSSELWALYEVSQTLSASIGLDDTLEILGRKLLAIFPDTGCVFLLRDLTERNTAITSLQARFAVGLNQQFLACCRTLNRFGTTMQVAREQVSYLGHFQHDDLVPTNPETSEWERVGCALIVPIVHQGESLGTINLYHRDYDAFGIHVQNLLETIAQRAAMALYNGLMFERTRSHAITDPLTGLANVRYITEWMEDRIHSQEENNNCFALLCLDLDSFKPINDNFGHQKGDAVLRDLAELFRNIVPDGDLVGRNGGDEFVVLLAGAGPREAQDMAERIQKTVHEYDPKLVHPKLGGLRIGVSVGTACFPNDGNDMATLLSVADAAMYRDKTERKLTQLVEGVRETPSFVNPVPVYRLPMESFGVATIHSSVGEEVEEPSVLLQA